jgi:O-antigen ligase
MRAPLHFLLSLFILFLPLQTVYLLHEPIIGGEKWQYGTIGIYATDIVLILLLLLYGRILFLRRTSQWFRRFFTVVSCSQSFLVLMLCLWVGLLVFWAPDKMLALYFFVKFLLAGGVFFVARSLNQYEISRVIILLFGMAVCESLLGIGQFLSQSTFASTWLGMSGHEVWQAGTSVLKNDTGRWLRAYGTFPHPNMLGGYLGAVLVLGIGQTFLGLSEKKERVFLLIGGVIILLGLLITFSRLAWFGTVLGLLTLVVLCFWYVFTKRSAPYAGDIPRAHTFFLGMMGALGIAAIVFVGVLHETVFPRFDGEIITHEGSASERMQSFRDARELMSQENIWFGVGGGNFTTAVKASNPERPIWSIQPAHNVPVLIFVELGIVGGILFFWLLLKTVWGSSIAILKMSKLFRKQLLFMLAFAVLLPGFLLDHWLWSSHFGVFFGMFLLGCASQLETTKDSSELTESQRMTSCKSG